MGNTRTSTMSIWDVAFFAAEARCHYGPPGTKSRVEALEVESRSTYFNNLWTTYTDYSLLEDQSPSPRKADQSAFFWKYGCEIQAGGSSGRSVFAGSDRRTIIKSGHHTRKPREAASINCSRVFFGTWNLVDECAKQVSCYALIFSCWT